MARDYNYLPEKFITFEKVEEIWSTNKKPVVAYLNNPFCQGKCGKNCKFCVHRGVVGESKETVNDFYFNYMPKQFKKYEKIIEQQNFIMVAFGGGTPNYLSAKDFDRYLNSLPEKFKPLPKQIELHAAFITREFLEVLAKHNFKIVTFCIQTFDKDILNTWNRLPPKDDIIDLMKYNHELGMYTAVDLITYWNASKDDFKILNDDLNKIKETNPDEVTVSVLYQNKKGDLSYIYRNLRSTVLSNFSNYVNFESSDTKNYGIAPTRYYNLENKDFVLLYGKYIDSLTAIEWTTDLSVSTLGIGCFKNPIHDVYSVIGGYKTIYEIYDGSGEEKYYLAKDYNFWDEAIKVINKLKETIGDDIEPGAKLSIVNIIKNSNYFFGNFEQGEFISWELATNNTQAAEKAKALLTKKQKTDFDILRET